MRKVAIVLFVMTDFGAMAGAALAQQSNTCKQCREQQQACNKNYAGKTCKTEYDICMKACQRK